MTVLQYVLDTAIWASVVPTLLIGVYYILTS